MFRVDVRCGIYGFGMGALPNTNPIILHLPPSRRRYPLFFLFVNLLLTSARIRATIEAADPGVSRETKPQNAGIVCTARVSRKGES